MAIGERIKRIRNLRKLTQKELGLAIGFDDNTADVRVAQYETGTRTPKEKYINAIASVLQINPSTLAVPDIDNYIGVLQTLFALEDIYGLKISSIDGELCLTLDKSMGTSYLTMLDMFSAWQTQSERLKNGEISQEDYDSWRYNYPMIEVERTRTALDVRRQNQAE